MVQMRPWKREFSLARCSKNLRMQGFGAAHSKRPIGVAMAQRVKKSI
ncbi:hypothetical protein V8J88_06270 [Massilia sp. W12]